MAHTAVFTVDGFAGAGVTLAASVLPDIRSFNIDIEQQMLKLTDSNGKVTNIAISDAATMTVTITGTYVSAVTIAN